MCFADGKTRDLTGQYAGKGSTFRVWHKFWLRTREPLISPSKPHIYRQANLHTTTEEVLHLCPDANINFAGLLHVTYVKLQLLIAFVVRQLLC